MNRNARYAAFGALILAQPLIAGCEVQTCLDYLPSFRVLVVVDSDIEPATIARLRSRVSAAGTVQERDLDVAPLRNTGRSAFVVLVGSPGAGGFQADISLEAFDVTGVSIARSERSISGSGDGCNTLELHLTGSSSPPVDAGPDDGAPPLDLPGPDLPVCVARCEGVRCGADDGCDGICQVGSGCVEPTYSWLEGNWRACSAACEGGTQSRLVQCVDDGGAVVPDDQCTGPKPPTSQACNTESCVIHEGYNCEPCPNGYTAQGGPCLGKFACNLQTGWLGRYYDTNNSVWVDGCAICNSGGGIDWQIYQLP